MLGAVLKDLSKAFDIISHDLLTAKLHAYWFLKKTLNLIKKKYLSNRWQIGKVHLNFSNWLEIIFGVPRESILGTFYFSKSM